MKAKANTPTVKYDWMTNRRQFIEACAKTILDAEIPQDHFWDEAKAFWAIALDKHLRLTITGNAERWRITNKEFQMYQRFRDDLKWRVFKKMPTNEED